MNARFVGMIVAIVFVGITVGTASAGLFDDITKTLNDAGNAIVESGNQIVQEVKEAGQEIGVVEKTPVPKNEKQGSSGSTKVVSTPSENQTPAHSKLPGGVTSRIKKMNKELDKVEKKLAKGAGTPVDRANRAKLDLKRAKGIMKEIENRYAGQFAQDHPEFQIAVARLASVEQAHSQALGIAVKEQNQLAEQEQARISAENEEAARLVREKQAVEDAEEAARASKLASCSSWDSKLTEFTYGPRAFNSYQTDDQELLRGWKTNYDAAKKLVQSYPDGLCAQADSQAKLIAQKMNQFEAIYEAAQAEMREAEMLRGDFVFSSAPIKGDGKKLVSQPSFNAGDYIYGMIRTKKNWAELYGKSKNFSIRVDVTIDGKKIHAQFITLQDSSYAKKDFLVFNVAPRLEHLAAYTDPNIRYGKTTESIVQGPNELSYELGKLGPGSHEVEFTIQYYGKVLAAGGFTVEGDDFVAYSTLHDKIAGGVTAARTLPPAKMKNAKFEKEMAELLREAGWSNVYRLNIIDKDWWIERVDGGNTAVSARYLTAAAITELADGSYCFRKCTFHQDRLLSGGFGKFYLSHQSEAVPIPKSNLDK